MIKSVLSEAPKASARKGTRLLFLSVRENQDVSSRRVNEFTYLVSESSIMNQNTAIIEQILPLAGSKSKKSILWPHNLKKAIL